MAVGGAGFSLAALQDEEEDEEELTVEMFDNSSVQVRIWKTRQQNVCSCFLFCFCFNVSMSSEKN